MANRRQIVTIYALVDPETHLVRYVGQTTRLASRYKEHCKGAYSATARWVHSLNDDPQLVVLETLPNEMVQRPGGGDVYIRSGAVAETKWLKRFRRTVANARLRDNAATVWDWLTNPDERTPTS